MKKIVLITGAAKGIGAEIAKVFAKNGYAVAIHYNKSESKAKELYKLLINNSCEAELFSADLSADYEAKRLISEVVEKMGRIDVLVNNAGISLCSSIFDVSDEKGREILNVNLASAIECSKYAAKDMLKRKSGKIINISSVWGISGSSCETYYSASKAGLIGFTKALSLELASSGITVNAVAPGVIETDMNAHFTQDERKELEKSIPLGRYGSPYEIAKTVLFLASSDADYITGETINISGGFLV